MNSVSTIAKIPFHGDTIEAVKTDDGTIMVSPLRVCEALGLEWAAQRIKLQAAPWACMSKIDMQVGAQRRSLVMLPLKAVPMWLAGISVNKVKPTLRSKLLAYQLEATEVLSAWFFGVSDVSGLSEEFADVKARLAKLEREHSEATLMLVFADGRINQAEIEAGEAEEKLDLLMRPFGDAIGEYMTLRQYFIKYGVMNSLGRTPNFRESQSIGRAVSAMSAALRIPVRKRNDGWNFAVNSYRIDVLQAWRASYDLGARTTEQTHEKIRNLILKSLKSR